MSNHVHIVFTPIEIEDGSYHALQTIMHSLKRHTALESNKILGREVAFWHHESFDHIVRDEEEFQRIVAYVLDNPVKAGLVERWGDWPWTYLKE
jgi:REP element-mobilizing transposase RayT